MDFIIPLLLLILGLILIIKGGDFFVDAASWIAERFGIPKFLIGATIVSIATTMPELLVSSMAAAKGQVDMAAGNAIGSVTANLGLILGISLIFIPGVIKRKQLLPKSIMMLCAAAILTLFAALLSGNRTIGIIPSILLAIVFVFFIWNNVSDAREALADDSDITTTDKSAKSMVINLIKFVIGAAGIVIGADLLVDNGTIIAQKLGIPEGIIAVTIIAIGTSLPELITTLTAIRKKQASLSVGNIIGANVIDLALILPICSIIGGEALPVSAQTAYLDLPASLVIGSLALVPALIAGRFKRWQGFALLGAYAVYMVLLITLFM